MKNLATIINEFDNAYKELHHTQAPSYFFDMLLEANNAGYAEAQQDFERLLDFMKKNK